VAQLKITSFKSPEEVYMIVPAPSVFERYNIVDERDVIDAMARLDTYTRDRATAETSAAEKRMAKIRHTTSKRAN
jgi:hypothetical protein